VQVNRRNAYDSITGAIPTPVNFINLLVNSLNKFSEFIKTKFNELRELFRSVFNFKQTPNAIVITPGIKGKIDNPLQNHSASISPPKTSDQLPQSIDKEGQVSSPWAYACAALVFMELATICYFLKGQSSPIPVNDPIIVHGKPIVSFSQHIPNALNVIKDLSGHNASFPCLPPLLCASGKMIGKPVSGLIIEKAKFIPLKENFSNSYPLIPPQASNIINETIPSAAEQISNAVDSIHQVATNPYPWLIGAGFLIAAAFAYGYFNQRRLNSDLHENLLRLQEEVKNIKTDIPTDVPTNSNTSDSTSTFNEKKEENTTTAIPKIIEKGNDLTPFSPYKPPIIKPQNAINPSGTTAPQNIGSSQELNNEKKPPIIPPLTFSSEVKDEESSEEKTINTNSSINKTTAKLDFKSYHHPLVRGHAAFEGKEEYRDEISENGDDSKKSAIAADILLLRLRDQFKKENIENTDKYTKSEIENLLDSFDESRIELENKIIWAKKRLQELKIKKEIAEQKTREVEEQKAKENENNFDNSTSSNRGGPLPRGGGRIPRGGPKASISRAKTEETTSTAKTETVTEEEKISNEQIMVIAELQRVRNKYNNKLEELKQNLIPDSKYSKYKFEYEDFKIICENIEKDLAIIDELKPMNIPKTPRSTNVPTNNEPVISEEEKIRIKQKAKIVESWNTYQKPLNLILIDQNTCQDAIKQITEKLKKEITEKLNTIELDDVLEIDRRHDVERLDELSAKMQAFNEKIEELEKGCRGVAKTLPTELYSPNTLKIASKITTDKQFNVNDAKKLTQKMTPRKPPNQKQSLNPINFNSKEGI